MKIETDIKVMFADDGGMILNEVGRTVYETDEKFAKALGEYIVSAMNHKSILDAEVTITIEAEE